MSKALAIEVNLTSQTSDESAEFIIIIAESSKTAPLKAEPIETASRTSHVINMPDISNVDLGPNELFPTVAGYIKDYINQYMPNSGNVFCKISDPNTMKLYAQETFQRAIHPELLC